jgi:hypothetical protein
MVTRLVPMEGQLAVASVTWWARRFSIASRLRRVPVMVGNSGSPGALHRDIDRATGWVSDYETRATTLRTEISDLTGAHDRAVVQRDAIRPGLVDRTREIRSVLDADALLRIDRVERDPPAHVRGLRRDENDKLWRTTVGGIEQYRAAYGIRSRGALGERRAISI